MEATTYEGWKNKPTWAVSLWIDNEESTYRYRQCMVRELLEERDAGSILGPGGAPADEHDVANELANRLELWVDQELLPDLGATLQADLLQYAVGQVDWFEIAQAWIRDELSEREYAKKKLKH